MDVASFGKAADVLQNLYGSGDNENGVSETEQEMIVGIDEDHINFLTSVQSEDDSDGDDDENEFIDPMTLVTTDEILEKTKTVGSGNIYSCHLCSKTFTWLKSLTVHIRTHTGEKPYKCHLCSRAFVRSDYLKYHLKSHSNEEIIKCEKCDIVFSTLRTLQRHNKSEHSEGIKLENNEEATQDEEGEFSCTYCDKSFDDVHQQEKHILVHDGHRPFECDLCEKSFIREDYLRFHRKQHSNDELINLEPEILFGDDAEDVDNDEEERGVQVKEEKHSLLASLLQQIVRTDGNRFQCPSCVKTFAHDTTLRIHLRTHTGEKPFQCSLCDHAFIRSDYLKAHLKKHMESQNNSVDGMDTQDEKNEKDSQMYTQTDDNKYQCNVCERTFAHYQTMKIHLRIHTNERPYRCYICSEAFIRSDYLKAHMKSHFKDGVITNGSGMQLTINDQDDLPDTTNFTQTKDGRWNCNICFKTFLHSASLRQHSRAHNGERPHRCEVCDKSFARIDYLKEHFKSKRHKSLAMGDIKTEYDDQMDYKEEPEPEIVEPMLFPTRTTRMLVFPKTLSFAENNHFERTDDGRYKCSFCDKTFVTSTTLKVHLRLHTGEKPYKCRKCGKAFIRSDYLKTHVKIHKKGKQESFLNIFLLTSRENTSCDDTDEEKIANGLAKKYSKHEDDLTEEVEEEEDEDLDEEMVEEEEEEIGNGTEPKIYDLVQSDDENDEEYEEEQEIEDENDSKIDPDYNRRAKHVCNLCNKRFVWPKSLKIHMRTHTGERPFKCDECDKTFNRSDSLRGHKKIHLVDRNVRCNLCDATFVLRRSLIKHQNSVHNVGHQQQRDHLS